MPLAAFVKFVSKNDRILGFSVALLTGLCGVLGVWFTYLSINTSGLHVAQQLTEQKKATSVAIVNDFLTALGEHVEDKNTAKFDKMVTIRAQLLIDNLEFPNLKGQLIGFLGRSDFGRLFDQSKENYINFHGIDLRGADMRSVKLVNTDFHCTNMPGVDLSSINLCGDEEDKHEQCEQTLEMAFTYTNMDAANLSAAQLQNSLLQWTNLSGAAVGGADLTGAKIMFSDLRGIVWQPHKSTDGDLERIAETLAEATSLYGSVMDKELKGALRIQLKEKQITLEDFLGNPELILGEGKVPETTAETWRRSKAKAEKNWCKEWVETRSTACKLARGIEDEICYCRYGHSCRFYNRVFGSG